MPLNRSIDSFGLYSVVVGGLGCIDEDACKTYALNICGDVNADSVHPDDIRNPSHFKINSLPYVDILSFGFPCNDFSIVGERKGIHGEYGPLYSYGVKVIDYFKPRFFVAENVSGLSFIISLA